MNDLKTKKKTSIGRIILYVILGFIALGILGAIFGDESPKTETTASTTDNSSDNAPKEKSTGIGEVLKTQYFDITANDMKVSDIVETGNEFTDVKAGNGNKFIIIDATFKNTDTESRMIIEGDLLINYNGKDYKYDATEPVMAEGFGSMLDQINPLISKSTKLVYKIPSELVGKVYWNPGRSDEQVILLGELK